MSTETPHMQELTMTPIRLMEIASRYRLSMRGEDRRICKMGTLASNTAFRNQQLTYALNEQFLTEFLSSGIAACIVPRVLLRDLPNNRSFLLTDEDPEEVFYTLFVDLVQSGAWQTIRASRGSRDQIAPTAVIHEPVVIGDDCRIMDHAVIFPNTRLGNRVVVKPNAAIGGDGFEAKRVHGRRQILPHAGGVWIEDDVEVGSSTCIDRGLFGEFTRIGSETKIDNLVHVAHSVTVGRCCSLIACSEVSGSAVLGDGVWLGPNSSVNQRLSIGDHCFVGTGSTVTRSLPRYALAYGSPAKVHGWVCACREKLNLVDEKARCDRCNIDYVLVGGVFQVVNL